jgi:ketosteroid isomerase-like protein
MRSLVITTISFSVLLFTKCERNLNKEKDEILIREVLTELEELGEKGDMNFMECYSEDAIWMQPRNYRDLTKSEAYPIYDSFLKEYRFDQDITIHEIQICNNWAYVRITADGWLQPKKGVKKDKRRAISRHLTILRKQDDGKWKIYRDMYNNPPFESK